MKHEVADRKLTIAVEEDILSTNVESLSNSFKELLNANQETANQIVLDLEGVETIDSQGLNLLIGLFQECKKRKWGFRVVHCSDNVKWLFSIFKLTDVFGVNASS